MRRAWQAAKPNASLSCAAVRWGWSAVLPAPHKVCKVLAMPVANRHTVIFICATIFIDAIGFGLIMPVLPRLLMSIGGFNLSRAIEIGSWMGLAMAVASFVAAPVLGNFSDAYGRRPVLLVALAGLAVDYLLLATVGTLPLIFLGRVLSGLFGGSYAPAQASIADVTLPQDRARNFGFVGAAFGIGFVLGPALGGLLTSFGNRAPFYAASALAALNFLYGLTVFPETLPRERRRRFTIARANPLGSWRMVKASPDMLQVVVVLLLWQLASLVYPLTWSFYGIARFGWSDSMIGLSLAAVGVVMAFAQVFVTGRLVRWLGERNAATLGILAAGTGYICYAFTTSPVLAFVFLGFIIFQAGVQPSLMAMLSRRATPETQGEVQGIAAMSMGVGSIIGPLVLTWPMAVFTRSNAPIYFPGAAFIIAAGFAVLAVVMLRRLPPQQTMG
jgi:DHA1 family tetracycline resistance protein-like MFS transporter